MPRYRLAPSEAGETTQLRVTSVLKGGRVGSKGEATERVVDAEPFESQSRARTAMTFITQQKGL